MTMLIVREEWSRYAAAALRHTDDPGLSIGIADRIVDAANERFGTIAEGQAEEDLRFDAKLQTMLGIARELMSEAGRAASVPKPPKNPKNWPGDSVFHDTPPTPKPEVKRPGMTVKPRSGAFR